MGKLPAAVYLLRFFLVVSPLSALVVWTFGALVIGAGAIVALAPERTAGTLAPLLLMQMFAASSGFGVPARRGHYDLLLTSTGHRTWIVLAHWLVSIAPGLASWLIVASVETFATGSAATTLASGTCAAMAVVSTIPWAITVALPRFSGGIGWLLVLTVSAITLSPESTDWLEITDAARPDTAAWAFLVYPMAAVGRHLSRTDLVLVMPALVLALASMAVACAWVRRAAFPLEAAQ